MKRFQGWPGKRRAAISLSFDDSAVSHLDHAFPVLQRWGLRGTFYVLPGEGSLFEAHVARWRTLHGHGHELGNHTLSHPCSRRHHSTPPGRALEEWTLPQIEDDIDAATHRLRALIPGLGPMSFAYPCGESAVGEGPSRRSYVPSVARRFVVARAVGNADNDPATCNLHRVHSWIVTGVSAEEMIDMIQPTVEAGRWGIFCFHGIGGDHLSVATKALEGLARYLKQHEHEIWVDTVYAVGRYLADARTMASGGSSPA